MLLATLLDSPADLIKAAATSNLGVLSLMVLLIASISIKFFLREHVAIRSGIFLLMLGSAVGFGIAMRREGKADAGPSKADSAVVVTNKKPPHSDSAPHSNRPLDDHEKPVSSSPTKRVVADNPQVVPAGLPAKGTTQTTDTARREITYLVRIRTSNVDHGGTDADVCVILRGVRGSSNEICKNGKEGHAFEKGQTDEMVLTTLDLGELQSLSVRHNNRHDDAGWHVSSIEVVNASLSKTWIFPCDCWLADDECDRRIERTLTAGQPPQINGCR